MNTHPIDITSAAYKRNPYSTLAKMQEMGPLVHTKLPVVGDVWLTTNYKTATDVLRTKDTFVNDPRNAGRRGIAGFGFWMPKTLKAITSNMLGKDEPDHRRLRKIVESAFLRQSIEAMRPRIEILVDRQLDELEEEAERNGGQAEFIKHFARPFPLAVISELLGLPEDDRGKFLHWASGFTNISSAMGLIGAIPAIWKISRYFRKQFALCRKEPRPGMISDLVTAEQDGKRLTETELLATAFLLLLAGHETTVHLITLGVLALLQHPDQKHVLMEDWSKSDTAVDELLRYNSTVQTTEPRYVAKDVDFHGVTLRRGEVVMPFLAAANCDPNQFANPATFDITRSPNQHIAFGTGIHVCLGLKLAKAEATTALEKLFTRFPDLGLAAPENELQWGEGLGTRSLLEFPLRLGKNAECNQSAAMEKSAFASI